MSPLPLRERVRVRFGVGDVKCGGPQGMHPTGPPYISAIAGVDTRLYVNIRQTP